MNHIFHEPARPSLRKWIKLHKEYGNQSIIRLLEYDNLLGKEMHGRAIDFGGGQNSRYTKYTNKLKELNIESINIDSSINPTYQIKSDLSGINKVPQNSYDYALCMNTLEHIEEPSLVLKHINTLLKKNGIIYISVPFMFRIHAHPDDFMRCTPSWWCKVLSRTGYKDIHIWPLVLGRATTAGSLVGFPKIFGPTIGRHIAFGWDYIYYHLSTLGADSKRRRDSMKSISIGWFIEARKDIEIEINS